ncbi:uncharacterized protein LOC143202620 isoform X1 [Rhynchophorus ferrugineus]|uniref:uncharacterized protein LOC143202620 isoform X1 n=1 Tax=Rhynchophorus ferrugineus TaxID=354439 RepID=UPI003FCCE48E
MDGTEQKNTSNCIIVSPTVLAKLHINTAVTIKNDTVTTNKIVNNENNQNNCLSEEKMLSEDGNIQIQRKRKFNSDGITNTTNNEGQLIKSSEDDDNNVSKKRGRGRLKKNLTQSTSKKEDSPVLDEVSITSSQRGRKVKRLNYSFIENSNPTDDIEKSDMTELCDDRPNKRRRGRPRKSLVETENIEKPNKEFEVVSGRGQEQSSSLDNENDNNKNELESEAEQGSSKYHYTGNTRKALNQMFKALQGKEETENGENPAATPTKHRGRPKLIENDVDGSSTCMNCNQTMPSSEWLAHNSQQHYNLAWRQGDLPLPINDEAFALKILTKLVKSKGTLKCNKCGVKMNKPQLFYEHLDVCNGVVNISGKVTCAVCQITMEKTAWSYHKYRQHNNLCWREGDPPLNLEDQDLVMRILTALYKSKKPLHCEKCDTVKKSVFGYLSHKTTCQKSIDELEDLKVKCHICGKKVLPVSMDCHLKIHTKIEPTDYLSGSNYFDSTVGSSGKRKAAKQALDIINGIKDETNDALNYYTDKCDFKEKFIEEYFQNQLKENQKFSCIFPNCDISIDSLESILEHIGSCDKKPSEYFLCKLCLFLCNNEVDILTHLKKRHDKTFNVDTTFKVHSQHVFSDEEEIENEVKEKKMLRIKSKQKMSMNPVARIKPLFLVHPMREESSNILYCQAYVWMREFCEEHYNKNNIHQLLRNKKPWRFLDSELLTEYLPEIQISCDVAARVVKPAEKNIDGEEWDWKRMELFEIRDFYEGDKTIFCGGSVTGLSWLPTPYNKEDVEQVLAVSVLNNREGQYQVDKNFNEPCLIQFWNFGLLNGCETVKPFLMSCIALNIGPIWHMEWCPSGCFDEDADDSRIGLLAVAGSDSFVYIYCVNRVPEHDRGLIYKAEPVLRLQLSADIDSLGNQSYYACKISWCKASGHRYIAVGYSMGVAAIFDLNTESTVLKKQNSFGEITIFPYFSIQAHYSTITVISLNHMNGGNRWLCTGSFDRVISYWDLHKNIKINTIKKTIVTDGLWMTLWPCAIISEDETTMANTVNTHIYIKPLRDAMTDTGNLTSVSSSLKALSYSDWLNAVLHCSSGGEVVALFNHRLLYNVNSKLTKTSYTKCLFATTKLVPKTDGASKEYRTYKDAANDFGLVFLDYQLDKLQNFPNTKRKNSMDDFKFSSPSVNEYCLQSVNKVQFNPNVQSCKYYVAGYHSGFVRLQHMKFLPPLGS